MALIAGIAALAARGGVYAFGIEPRRLVIRAHRVPWPPEALQLPRLRIGVLSDIHAAWPHTTPARLARVVRRILEFAPDLVLLPGDFATTDTYGVLPIAPEPMAEALRPLAARVRTFAVLGNHDYDFDGARVATALERVGIRVLANEAVAVPTGEGMLWLVGLDDPVTLRHDLQAAFVDLPESEPAILLSHTPDVHAFAPPNVRLVIAGHTHGGQVCLPAIGPLITMSRLPRQQAHGLHDTGERHLFVTAGVGTTGLPLRFLRPPEFGILDLVPVAEPNRALEPTVPDRAGIAAVG
jgi:predicted MPP superfamily phosphohydrolase